MQVGLGKSLGDGVLSEQDLAGLAITMEDFDAAIRKVQPSVRREGFATTPDVTWEDVGALREVHLHSNLLRTSYKTLSEMQGV